MAPLGVIILISSGGACHPNPVSLEDVAGNWRDIEGGEFIQFNQDRSYRAAKTPDFDAESLIEAGRFSLVGRRMTISISEESPSCAGEARRFEVEEPGADRLRLIWEDGACDLRPDAEVYELERVK